MIIIIITVADEICWRSRRRAFNRLQVTKVMAVNTPFEIFCSGGVVAAATMLMMMSEILIHNVECFQVAQ